MTKSASPWWARQTAYQIYPRSFADANGDGVGDIPGIISRLDHLQDLGIGILWLSPVFTSPMVDNGYDISNYRDIAPEFGTLEDMDTLIHEARVRGIRIVMDLVVNHTSDQHPWFQDALADPTSPFRDFYVWRDPAPDGGPPNDLRSYFGGPAWSLEPKSGQYFLHFFAKEQPDLNWENPALRAEVYDMMRWWRDRGIGGFRMDVIDHIGKVPDEKIATDGPRLHEYLQEMHREVLAGSDLLTIGESWSVTTDTALLYTGQDRAELDMMFQFAHIVEGWDPDGGKWKPLPFDLPAFKRVWFDWQAALSNDGWNALFLSNHDLPRQVSRYGNGSPDAAKAIATAMHLMKGTPFIYQGEEIGMPNAGFDRIEDYRDLETLNLYDERVTDGVASDDFLQGAMTNSRDNARTPVAWSDDAGAGFTTGTPWITIPAHAKDINVAGQANDPDSPLAHYKTLVQLRKDHAVITDGDFEPVLVEDDQVFAYARQDAETRLYVVVNWSDRPARVMLPAEDIAQSTTLISTHGRERLTTEMELAPWEAVVSTQNVG